MIDQILEQACETERGILASRLSDKQKAVQVSALFKKCLEDLHTQFDYEVEQAQFVLNEVRAETEILRGEIDLGMEPVQAVYADIALKNAHVDARLEALQKREEITAVSEEKMRKNGLMIQKYRDALRQDLNDINLIGANAKKRVSDADIRVAQIDEREVRLSKDIEKFAADKVAWETQKAIEMDEINTLREVYQEANVVRR